MSRRPKRELRWNQPTPAALKWVRLCIESAREFSEKNERRDFAQYAKLYGLEWARRWLREDRRLRRMHAIIISLTLQLPEEEQRAMMAWWQESATEDPLPPDKPEERTEPGERA